MGVTALDSGVLIGFFDATDTFHRPAVDAVTEALADGSVLVPAVAFAEVSIAVLRAGAPEGWLKDVLDRLAIRVGDLDAIAAAAGARLRAAALGDRRRRQWKTPDALIAGEAMTSGADRIITTDARWPHLFDLPVVVLGE